MRAKMLSVLACLLLIVSGAACGGGGGGAAAISTPEAKRIQEAGGKPWTQTKTGSPVQVISAKLFFTGLGETAFAIGELENKGSSPVTGVSLTIKGYAQEGRLLDTREGEVPVAVIPAGGRAPFKITVDLLEVARYELIVDSSPAQTVPENKLEVSKTEMSKPKTGYVWVTGEVKNAGASTVPSVEIITVLRDSSSAIVEVGIERLSDALEAGQTASFKYMVMFRDATKMEVMAQPARD